MEIEFEIEKETKGTVRYQETSAEGTELVGTLYVKKSGLRQIMGEDQGDWPAHLKVEITAEV